MSDHRYETREHDINMLCRLAYYALAYGKAGRAADYLTAAAALDPDHPQILRLQAVAYLDVQAPGHALSVIRKLEARYNEGAAAISAEHRTTLLLLKARAMHAAAEPDEARKIFAEYLAARKNTLTD